MTDPITALVPWIPSGTFEDSVQLRQRLALGQCEQPGRTPPPDAQDGGRLLMCYSFAPPPHIVSAPPGSCKSSRNRTVPLTETRILSIIVGRDASRIL